MELWKILNTLWSRTAICKYDIPVVLWGVLEKFSQLQRIFADFLDGREQEASDGDVDHLLEEATGLKEMFISARLHEAMQLSTRHWMGVTVLGVDRETLPLKKQKLDAN